MKPNHLTTWQPIRSRADTDPYEGIRVPIGRAVGSRSLMGLRRAIGFARGAVVPTGIVLKEEET